MLKEIYEQPRSIKDSMRGRLISAEGGVNLGGITENEQKYINARKNGFYFEAKRVATKSQSTTFHHALT